MVKLLFVLVVIYIIKIGKARYLHDAFATQIDCNWGKIAGRAKRAFTWESSLDDDDPNYRLHGG